MITAKELEDFLHAIPPKPDILQKTLLYVQTGDLTKAALTASDDDALTAYLRNFVNKPSFYFKSEVKDLKQIFGILGVNAAKELLYHYMLSLFSPKEWHLFKLNETTFSNLQARLSSQWKKILESQKIPQSDITSVISLIPSSIIITELLFAKHIKEVTLLKESQNLDYNTILDRLTGMTLFDIATMIAQNWELNPKAIKLLNLSAGTQNCDEGAMCKLSRFLHLLFFHTLSQPEYIEAGLNDFLDFQPEYVMPVMEEFQKIVGTE